MSDLPKAKLIRHIPSGHRLPYWDTYEYECVECGATFTRGTNTSRINPYCGKCWRKHENERVKERKAAKEAEHDAKIRADAQTEILDILHGIDRQVEQMVREQIKEQPCTT